MIELNKQNLSTWSRLGMRKAFGLMMEEIAPDYPDLIVLAADVADSANLNSFSKQFPEQFYNIGIAEQNMTAIACGLAHEYNNVFICSFAPFVSMRNYEAVRSLIGYMNLNVKIIALSSGMSLGVQGSTHYGLEDISLMRTIPNMMVLSPTDVVEEAECISYLADYNGPAYLRLTGIDGIPPLFDENHKWSLYQPAEIREGDQVAMISTGSVTYECLRATRALKKEGISCALISMCCLNPIDTAGILDIINRFRIIFTVEEHFKKGGLGDIISEIVAESGIECRLVKMGIDNGFPHPGDYSYMLDSNFLSASHIKECVSRNMTYFFDKESVDEAGG